MPVSVRALLWWPAAVFVLVAIEPETSPAAIVAVGALLMMLGGLHAAIAKARRPDAPAEQARPSH